MWPGVYSEEGQPDLAVKISLMTFESAISLECLGFKDLQNSKMGSDEEMQREGRQKKKS